MFEAVALAAIESAKKKKKKRKNSGTMSSRTKDKKRFIRKFDVAPHMGYMSAVIQEATDFFFFFMSSVLFDMCKHPNVSGGMYVTYEDDEGGSSGGSGTATCWWQMAWCQLGQESRLGFLCRFSGFFFFPFLSDQVHSGKFSTKFCLRLQVCDLAPSVADLSWVLLLGET